MSLCICRQHLALPQWARLVEYVRAEHGILESAAAAAAVVHSKEDIAACWTLEAWSTRAACSLEQKKKPTARASDGAGTVQNERHSGWNA